MCMLKISQRKTLSEREFMVVCGVVQEDGQFGRVVGETVRRVMRQGLTRQFN